MKNKALLIGLAVCAVVRPQRLTAGGYEVTDLGRGIAFEVNSSGTVVGENGVEHPFVWTAATGMQDLGGLGPGWGPGEARSVNDQGDVVGFFYRASGANLPATAGFYWTPSQGIRDIGQPAGFSSSIPIGIDNQGNVTVWASTDAGASATYRWRADSGWTFVAAGTPQAANASGMIAVTFGNSATLYSSDFQPTPIPGFPTSALNAHGDLVVTSTKVTSVPSTPHASFYWNQQTGLRDMGAAPGDSFFGLNDAGVAVGSSGLGEPVTSPNDRGIIWTADSGVRPLSVLLSDAPGWTLETGLGINDAGQIVGQGTIGGEYHAFLMTYDANGTPGQAVPDAASTFPLLCAGLLALATLPRQAARSER